MSARLVWAPILVYGQGRCHVDLATVRVRNPKKLKLIKTNQGLSVFALGNGPGQFGKWPGYPYLIHVKIH